MPRSISDCHLQATETPVLFRRRTTSAALTVLTLGLTLALSLSLSAGLTGCVGLPGLSSGSASINTARLDSYMQTVQRDADAGLIPGAVLLVAREGRVLYVGAVGLQDPATKRPMARDSIFRIYSMTKPMVSVAALQLVEEGKIGLSAPVSLYLPELKGLQVGVQNTGADGKVALERMPARREMTVQDLLRHTSGLTYGVFGTSMVKEEYLKSGVHSRDPEFDNVELVRRVAKLPLAYQPGTTWEYSISTDILGALVEKVSGKSLDAVLNERILRPLKMSDTGFWVTAEKQSRIAEPFPVDPDNQRAVRLLEIRKPPRFLSGGGGLTSTVDDYFRFAQMLANGGELDGVRLLARKTVEWMTSDHTDGMRGPAYLPGAGYGFGLGVAVRTATGQSTIPGSVGDFHWGGIAGTHWWADPREKLVAVWMIQGPGRAGYFRSTMRTAVYTALQ